MIVRDQPSSLQLFFVMQGSVVPKIWAKILGVAVFTTIILFIDLTIYDLPHISLAAMGVFGIALSLFLGFRNNAAYDRWWEARKLWGSLIADARTIGRTAVIFLAQEDVPRVLRLIVVFAHLHRASLRKTDPSQMIRDLVDDEHAEAVKSASNPADATLRIIAMHLRNCASKKRVSDIGNLMLSETLASISLAQAGCERIASTPLPFVYSLLVRRTTYLYCVLLPFALIESTSLFAPVFSVVVAYVFFGLQAVTNELEMPFADVPNGLPLDAMCRTIETSIAEALDEPVPEPLSVKGYVLS